MSTPIRVLQVVNYMGRGGLETFIMNCFRNIDREKVCFDFLVHSQDVADYDEEIESMGGVIYRLPRLVPWSISYKKALRDFFNEHPEYRIVHVHRDCMSSVVLKEAMRHGIPVRIAHSHNSSQDKDLKYPIKLLCKRSIPKYSTHLFACSKDAGDFMFGGAPYEVLPNAIDVGTFAFDPSKGAKMRAELSLSGELAMVHVGRFMTPKNHVFLLDIFAALLKKEPGARLFLIGDGELADIIKQKAHLLGIFDRVTFLGVRSDVADLLSAMDVFVFPSLYEGLPLSLVEAQTSGLPCVISDRVPAESAVSSSLVKRLSLSDDLDIWVDAILGSSRIPRTDHSSEVAKHGFDVKIEAEKLRDFYINAHEQYEK